MEALRGPDHRRASGHRQDRRRRSTSEVQSGVTDDGRSQQTGPKGRPWRSRRLGFAKLLLKRAATITVAVFIAIYIGVVVANLFGYWDDFKKSVIRREVRWELFQHPNLENMTQADRDRFMEERFAAKVEEAGLNDNFFVKSLRNAWDVMTLKLRPSRMMTTAATSTVGDLILERMPRTILLFTTGTLFGASLGVVLGLRMARRALSFEDRAVGVVSIVASAAPAWVWGIFLMLVFGLTFQILPYGGMFSVPASMDPVELALDLVHHMILPVAAIAVATFGVWAYTTRNLCLQVLSEDYVEAARARGLPNRILMRRYVLRAAAPALLTALTFSVVGALQASIILELWFNWPGIGRLMYDAIGPQCELPCVDVPVVMGVIVTFAYLVAITVFVLDFVYLLFDPRMKTPK